MLGYEYKECDEQLWEIMK